MMKKPKTKTNKANLILKKALEKVSPSEKELQKINLAVSSFLEKLNQKLGKSKTNAEVFLGGSFAKKTLIKKDKYDVDIFLRFNEKYKNKDISNLTEKILKSIKNPKINIIKIHGSRDYFRIKLSSKPILFAEIVPVIKITNPKKAENITDLSYSHVNYIKRKIKSQDVLDEIRLAKSFCHANNCYGAESYINGFSGYALELLVYHYGSFLNMLKKLSKALDNMDKLVIDIEKHYKNKTQVMLDINASKLQSPIILVDPTFKQRNILAALSKQTFEKFQRAAKSFLIKPAISTFEIQKPDLEKIKNNAKARKLQFILLEAKTNKQEGDVAGSKLFKFYNFLAKEINKFFITKQQGFQYDDKKSAIFFFVVKPKKEILIQGPRLKQKENIQAFKRVHKNKKIFLKQGRIFSREKAPSNIIQFMKAWKKKNARRMKEMSVISLD